MTDYNFDVYKDLLKDKLDEYRYRHSLAVADKARQLALKYGADSEKAYLSGLLHDITKNLSREEHLKIFDDFDIILTDVERQAEKLWHAISGAAYVREILKIEDSDIYHAIRYHTTAKSGISLLSKIIYVSDFISDDRSYSDVDVMRSLADTSLEVAMKYALSYTIKDLVGKGVALHIDTVNAYNELALKGI